MRKMRPTGSDAGAIRVADGRFLAPSPVERVRLEGDLDDWRVALEKVGIQVVDDDPDLVVCERRHARQAVRLDAPAVLVLGAARGPLRRSGYATRLILVRPGSAGPRLYVPVDFCAA